MTPLDTPKSERPPLAIRIYSTATHIAMARNQVVGPHNYYYVTLEQLEAICQKEWDNEQQS
jgi:hypothetical protein